MNEKGETGVRSEGGAGSNIELRCHFVGVKKYSRL